MFAGTIGLFLALFFLFIRFLPAIAIFEMRTIVPEAKLHPTGHKTPGGRPGQLADHHG
jgi:molybdopterin-containing oxidoreductase family membrane subunit